MCMLTGLNVILPSKYFSLTFFPFLLISSFSSNCIIFKTFRFFSPFYEISGLSYPHFILSYPSSWHEKKNDGETGHNNNNNDNRWIGKSWSPVFDKRTFGEFYLWSFYILKILFLDFFQLHWVQIFWADLFLLRCCSKFDVVIPFAHLN